MIKKEKIFESLQSQFDTKADEKAGYPPNCNEGYVAKDGKCVPIDESEGEWPKKKKKNDKG